MSRAGDAIYRALLRAFPRRFREARADEMARLFAEQRQRVAGRPLAIARLWWLAARDAIGHGLRARLRSASVTAAGRHAQDRASVSSSGLRAVAQPLRDVRLAVRVLRRTPVPTLVAVIALGLGIGVNAAIVSVVHELLIDPLPYPHADRLVLPWQRRGDSQTGLRLTPRITSVDRWREAKTLDAVVVYSNTRVTLGDGGTATVVEAVRIEPALLDFTGTRVIAGRPFTAADVESETAARQVLIGETLWATRFGRDAAALGRTITLDDVPHTIVGVLPRSFRLPLNRPELVVPLVRPRPAKDGQAVFFPIGTLARLAAGVSVEAAEAELTALAKGTIDPSWTVALRTAAEHLGGPVRDALIVLLGAVACVLLIACANVAHLLLAKNVARQRELSVRAALGATRARIFGQLMTEYLVLAVTAGVFGAAVA
ncbi:MAG TPA: ABC transporter permease, partial [Vicinamibacterales bacterium]|nr:ABC transporter permease [Vicinamibacterales bacterium]